MTRKIFSPLHVCFLYLTFTRFLCAQPELVVSPQYVDFGDCGHRERLSRTLFLRNTGSELLIISGIRKSCDCIQLRLDGRLVSRSGKVRTRIAPGKSASLEVILNTGRATGILEKYVEIRSSDPARSVLKIPVAARVHATLRTDPWTLPSFTAVAGGKPVIQQITLLFSAPPSTSPALDNLRTSDPAISVRATALSKEGLRKAASSYRAKNPRSPYRRFYAGYRLQITIRPPLKEGFFSGLITAVVNGKHWELPVHGYIFRGIVVEPRYFQFGGIEDPTLLEKSITLRSADGTPFSILSIECNPPILSFEVRSAPDGLSHTIAARIATEDRSRRFFAKVRIRTSHPLKPLVEVSCLGFWKKARK